VIEVTGLERDDAKVKAIVGTFQALKNTGGVDESTKIGAVASEEQTLHSESSVQPILSPVSTLPLRNGRDFGLNLSYTFNLNLPNSTDPEVFSAIFDALKKHLLAR
jgi:hypothetical protein